MPVSDSDKIVNLQDLRRYKELSDAASVHKTGDETIGGGKTFTSPIVADVKTDASARLLSERLADVVNVKDYGAKGDGSTDDTEAVKAAVAAAQPGDTVVFPNGEYVISSGIALKSGLTVDGQDSTILYTGSYYLFTATGSLSSEKIKLAQNTGKHANSITLESVANVSVNDWFLLTGQRDAFSLNAGEDYILGAATANANDIAFAEPISIRSISGNSINLYNNLVFNDYNIDLSGELDSSIYINEYSFIQKLFFKEDIVVKNFTIKSDNNTLICVYFTYCRNCRVYNVRSIRSVFDSKGQLSIFKYCLNCTADTCTLSREGGSSFSGDHSNFASFKDVSSWYDTFVNCFDENGVQGIDCSFADIPSIYPTITNCKFFNNVECGITTHSGVYGIIVKDNEFRIGRAVSGTAPAGIFLRSPYAKVIGNSFYDDFPVYSDVCIGIRVFAVPTYVNHSSSNIATYRSCFQNTEIKNNVFNGVATGVWIQTGYCDSNGIGHARVAVADNSFEACYQSIFVDAASRDHVAGWDSIESGLIVQNNVFSHQSSSSVIVRYCNRPVIQYNITRDTKFNSVQQRCIATNFDQGTIKNAIITDNIFINVNSGYAISEYIPACEGVVLRNNKLYGSGSLCSVDLSGTQLVQFKDLSDLSSYNVALNNVNRSLADRFSDVVNVKDFGAKGDGTTDDGVAIQAALDRKGLVYFPSGVYNSSRQFLIYSDTAILGDNNAEIVFTNQYTNNAGFFTDGKVLEAVYSLASDVYRGDINIVLDSVDGLAAGDAVLVADDRPNQTTGDPSQGTEVVSTSRGHNGEIHKIKSVDISTSTITLYEGLWSEDFTTARNAFVKKLSMAKNISIQGISIKSGAQTQGYGIVAVCVDGFVVKNISVEGFYHAGIVTNLSLNGVIDGCRFKDIINSDRSLGYSIIHCGSQCFVTRSCTAELCGKLWDTGCGSWEDSNNIDYHYGNSRFLTCRDSSITSPLRCGISTHEPTDYVTIENNIVSAQGTQEIYAMLFRSNNVSVLNNTILYTGRNEDNSYTRGIYVTTRGKAGRVDVSGNKVVACKGTSIDIIITDVNSDGNSQTTEYTPTLVSVSNNYIEPYVKSDIVAPAPIIIDGEQVSGFASVLINGNLVYRASNSGNDGGIVLGGKLSDATISNNVVHGQRCVHIPSSGINTSTDIDVLNIFSNYFEEQHNTCVNIDTPSTVKKFIALNNAIKPPFASASLFSTLPASSFVSNIKIKSTGVFLEGSMLELFVGKAGADSISGEKVFAQGPYGTAAALSGTSISLAGGSVFTKTISADTDFTIVDVPAATASFKLILTDGGAYTVTWPSSVKWAGGAAPALTASGTDVLRFITPDGGTTWYGKVDVADAS